MTESYFVSAAALRHLKGRARSHLPTVSSSHLSEAIAAALGFRTHAALRASLAGKPTVEALRPARGIVDPNETLGIARADAFARCWLERRLGAWIQDGGEGFGCKRAVVQRVADVQIAPTGYADQGPFIM